MTTKGTVTKGAKLQTVDDTNWTEYKLRDGSTVRWTGKTNINTGSIIGITIDYGSAGQATLDTSKSLTRGTVAIELTGKESRIDPEKFMKDVAQIMGDKKEQDRARTDITEVMERQGYTKSAIDQSVNASIKEMNQLAKIANETTFDTPPKATSPSVPPAGVQPATAEQQPSNFDIRYSTNKISSTTKVTSKDGGGSIEFQRYLLNGSLKVIEAKDRNGDPFTKEDFGSLVTSALNDPGVMQHLNIQREEASSMIKKFIDAYNPSEQEQPARPGGQNNKVAPGISPQAPK